MLSQSMLSDRQLRYFGLSLAALFLAFAGLAFWKWQATAVGAILVVIATLLVLVYYLVPSSQRPIYGAFRKVTTPIQIVMTVILLAVVYFLVLTPIGWMLRWSRVNIRRKSKDYQTFWVKGGKPSELSRYFDTY